MRMQCIMGLFDTDPGISEKTSNALDIDFIKVDAPVPSCNNHSRIITLLTRLNYLICKLHTNTLAARFYQWSLHWRHNGRDGVSNHQLHYCWLNPLFRRKSKKTSKLRVIGLCEGNSPGTGEFPVQMASYAENVSIWWRHHVIEDNISQMICKYICVCSCGVVAA